MNKTLVLCLLYVGFCHAQNPDLWYTFTNQDSTLVGFKNSKGKVTVQPKFLPMILGHTFEHIIGVSEKKQEKWNHYYLTKSGDMVAENQVYFFDNAPDCENEGFVRFRDYEKDKVGLLNKNGAVVIPAIYNDLTKVKNGMLMALKDAQKKTVHGGEHSFYVGGRTILIDTLNTVLVDDFSSSVDVDFYSLQKSEKPVFDNLVVQYKSKNGIGYYIFKSFEKEFSNWFFNELLIDLTVDKLIDNTLDMMYFRDANGWGMTEGFDFVERNFELLQHTLQNVGKQDYMVIKSGLNPYIYEADMYQKYYNNCNEPKSGNTL